MSLAAPAQSQDLRRLIDQIERAVIVALWAFLVYRFAAASVVAPANLIYLFAEGIVMVMVLCRRSTDQITTAPLDWFFAFGGTFASMMLMPGTRIEALAAVPETLLLAGLAVSLFAKLQLRRSFGIVAANRGLKTTGIYGVVRHPMYLGYFLLLSGMLMLNFSIWNALVTSLWAAFQIARIQAEERVLGLDPGYRAHMERTRYRLLPLVY